MPRSPVAEPSSRATGPVAVRVTIVTPAGAGVRSGNQTTGERWCRLLTELGHRVVVVHAWKGESTDVLIALHAGKSHDSIARYHAARPNAPLVVALAGTDLYRDLDRGDEVRRSLALADRIVTLQRLAATRLPPELAAKTEWIIQSATPPATRSPAAPNDGALTACLLAHLRPIKDPLLAAAAVRHLPADSRWTVVHGGADLDHDLAARAAAESRDNPRYRWLGPLEFDAAQGLLASADLLLLTSHDEGGANVVSEAIVAGVPLLSTRIDGSVGLLGDDYPGYFPVGDSAALAALLGRFEDEPAFAATLADHVARLRPQFTPERERAAWQELLQRLAA